MADLAPVPAKVYSYGGCTSCGSSFWNFLRQNKIEVEHINVQIPYERTAAQKVAAEHGIEGRVYFPLILINGECIMGFKPEILSNIINEVRNNG